MGDQCIWGEGPAWSVIAPIRDAFHREAVLATLETARRSGDRFGIALSLAMIAHPRSYRPAPDGPATDCRDGDVYAGDTAYDALMDLGERWQEDH